MGSFRLDQNFINKIEKQCQEKAKNLAHEASEKLTNHYITLLDWYYADYQPKLNKYDEPYYTRTFNLYKSAHKYYKNGTDRFYGGVRIDGTTMKDYPGIRNDSISGQDLLNTYIYNTSGAWHGGDWHGGYGVAASFNIYNEMEKYKNELIKDMQNRCKI